MKSNYLKFLLFLVVSVLGCSTEDGRKGALPQTQIADLNVGQGDPAAIEWRKVEEALKVEDYATAKRIGELLANQGHPRAQFLLGGLYRFGEGVDQDDKLAIKLFI